MGICVSRFFGRFRGNRIASGVGLSLLNRGILGRQLKLGAFFAFLWVFLNASKTYMILKCGHETNETARWPQSTTRMGKKTKPPKCARRGIWSGGEAVETGRRRMAQIPTQPTPRYPYKEGWAFKGPAPRCRHRGSLFARQYSRRCVSSSPSDYLRAWYMT